MLREFGVPATSQVLVFSRTSLQRERIRPDQPRAIYFSDDTYIAWVPGGLIEVASIDPVLGPVFHALDPAALRAGSATAFVRDGDCLRCHGGTFVRDIPGVFTRSVFVDAEGEPLLQHGSELVDFRTPFENRWGGWYVTGRHGNAMHRGNVTAGGKQAALEVDFSRGANITDLSAFFPTRQYPAASSDIVALLVMEHQTAMHNTLTRASLNARRLLAYQQNLQRDMKEPVTGELVLESVRSAFNRLAQDVVDDLLFQGEAPLPAGIEGSPQFRDDFLAGAARTAEGHSLKQLSLDGRLFTNRCSYLIYSALFLELPVQLKQLVYARLAGILAAEEPEARYAYLPADERQRIVHILRATHPELAAALAPEGDAAAARPVR